MLDLEIRMTNSENLCQRIVAQHAARHRSFVQWARLAGLQYTVPFFSRNESPSPERSHCAARSRKPAPDGQRQAQHDSRIVHNALAHIFVGQRIVHYTKTLLSWASILLKGRPEMQTHNLSSSYESDI